MTRLLQIFGSLLLLFLSAAAFGASSFELDSLSDKHHVTADRTLYHSNEKVYEAFGHVVVSSKGQRLSADYLWVDNNTKEMKARGNVIFVDKETTIQAAEIHFNLDTGIGSIFYGKVFNDKYTLKGQLIRRVSENRFLTTEGEYTTCKDCAESWKFSARYVDLTMEGYAFLDSVFIKIKDVPTLYIPYAIIPVKTKRQSGFLFPRMAASSNNGFVFVQPFFLAISPHQDLTVGAGRYSVRGMRYEGEYRYRSYNGIKGQINFFHTGDRRPEAARKSRVALKTEHEWPFAKNFGMRLRGTEVLDREYIYDFPEDISGQGYPSLESNAIANAPFNDFFASVEARRYRNLLTKGKTGFDGGTVQAIPTAYLGIKEREIAGPLLASFSGRYDKFRRTNRSFSDSNGNEIFDPNFDVVGNTDMIRETDRFILSPEISAPFRLGRYLSIGPSAQYNEIRYQFAVPVGQGKNLPHTYNRYVQTKLEASTVLERVYDYDGEKVSRVKHQLQPFITFSYIPWIDQDSSHLFQKQVAKRSEGLFDQYDVIPVTNSTSFLRYPQGKSIYYGFNSRLIRKMKNLDEMPRAYPYDLLPAKKPKKYPTPYNRKQELAIERDKVWDQNNPRYADYDEIWNVSVSQAFDFKDARYHRDDPKRAFSYLLAKSFFRIPRFSHSFEYKYFPRILAPATTLNSPTAAPLHNKHRFTTSLNWDWVSLTNLRQTHSFVRSIGLTYTNNSQPTPSRYIGANLTWSVNDYINFKTAYAYDLLTHKQNNWSSVAQLTHPSECWGMAFRYDWNRDRSPKRGEVGFELLLNLMGTGFTGFSQDRESGGVFGG